MQVLRTKSSETRRSIGIVKCMNDQSFLHSKWFSEQIITFRETDFVQFSKWKTFLEVSDTMFSLASYSKMHNTRETVK